MGYFKGKQFKKDIILVAVGYYCRFSLSYRDVSEILKERDVWHLDETYIKVKGEWCYLYHAIDQDGYILDIQLRKIRDHQASYMFMKRLIKAFEEPTVLITDKAPALLCALKKRKHNGFYVYTNLCNVKHFNDRIEQDHRHIKPCFVQSARFQRLCHTSRTLKGVETIHALYKLRFFPRAMNYSNYSSPHKR